jgi:RNA polymerase sigma-70 factor, ECF subfamily
MAENKDKKVEHDFLEFYDSSSSNILRHIFFRVSDAQLAQDLASETFLKAWQYLKDGYAIDNLKNFIYKVANNLIIDYYRSKKNIPVSLEIAVGLPDKNSINMMDLVDTKIESEIIRIHLALLPDHYKKILIYRFIDDLSISEIKALTGKSASNIYVIIHRGLKMLKASIDKKTP